MPKSVAIQSVCLRFFERERRERKGEAGGRAEMQRRGAQLMQRRARQAAAERRIDLGDAERERARLLGQRFACRRWRAAGAKGAAPSLGREHGESHVHGLFY